MQKVVSLSLVAALSFGAPALAQEQAAQPAPQVEQKQPEKPGLVENISGAVGGVLASTAAATGGPLASAVAAPVGNKIGRGVGGFFKRMFGGGKKKAVEAPQQQAQAPAAPPETVAPSVDQAAQPASAQAPETPVAAQTPPQTAADPIGDLIADPADPAPVQ